MRDSRVRGVAWHDLTSLTRYEVIAEVLLSLPWILASWWLAYRRIYIPALGCSFIFFLTGLRQVHNAYHYSLGLARRSTEWFIFLLSILMLGSMHAIQITHLHHHRHCMDDEDVEARSARMSALQALVFGPAFPIMLHAKAAQLASRRQRLWIAGELTANVAFVALIFALRIRFLEYHILAMATGQCLTAFFAVWTVHHDCDRSHHIARTLRGRLKTVLTFEMFYHIEHHLFPAVPTRHLSKLAERLDVAAPELQDRSVF